MIFQIFLSHFSELFSNNFRDFSGWLELQKSIWRMDEWTNQWLKNIFWKSVLLCFENSTCVFGRPVVFYELRIQPFCYFWMSRTVAAVPTEAMRRWKTTFQLLCSLTNIFSLSTCQSCDYSTEKLIECKWDNTNSCCVQTLIVWKSSVGDKKLDHSHLISIVHHF